MARGAKIDATVSLIDMYPTLVEQCGLKPANNLEGESLASVLADPSTAKDRDVYLPYLDPGGYAIINKKWRYIHYSDNTEELYDVSRDPNEWNNIADRPKFVAIKRQLRASAPKSFAPLGTPKNRLRLVLDGDDFHWELKKKPARKKPNKKKLLGKK
jgi:arylsulfatase A-like enzyme